MALTLQQKQSLLNTLPGKFGNKAGTVDSRTEAFWQKAMSSGQNPLNRNVSILNREIEKIKSSESKAGSPQYTLGRTRASDALKELQEGSTFWKSFIDAGAITLEDYSGKTLEGLIGETGQGFLGAEESANLATPSDNTLSVAGFNTSQPTQTAQNGADLRKLGSTELTGLQAQWKQEGLTQQEIEQNFLSRSGADISLKTTAPSSQQIIASRQVPQTGVGDINASMLGMGSTDFDLPSGTAGNVMQSYVTGVGNDLQNKKTSLQNTYNQQLEQYKTQSENLQKQIDDLTTKEEGALGDVEALLQPFRADFEEAERQRLKVTENYFANQSAVSEMETLLTQMNEEVEAMQAQTGLSALITPRISKTIQDATARVGILESVIALRNNQISTAFTLIDRSVNAVNADRQDKLTYYNSLLSFYDSQKTEAKSLLKTSIGDQKDTINAQIGLIEDEITNSQLTADTIKKLMLDPESALMIQESGITLNDSIPQINAKIANWQRLNPETVKGGGGGGGGGVEEPLSINKIEQFRRSYGWTPPFGYTEEQLLQYMNDNPDATPEELEAGAKQSDTGQDEAGTSTARNTIEGVTSRVEQAKTSGYSDDEIKKAIKDLYSEDELFALAKSAGYAKWYTGKEKDINRMLDSIL